MGFLEDFQASVESLPSMLHRNYSLMRELDKSLQGVQLENEQRCQQEIEDIKHGLESGSITYDPAKLKFSEEAIEEQKHCVRIADEKVALATQTYDLTNSHFRAKVPTELPAPAIDLELPVDPNEPTYCFCNQVSYGEMVACDNPNCKIEWYHIGCVGVKELPKGKWYCPSCVGFQKKRKGK
ncbi:PHD finger protein ING1-like isoform X3 [Panicum miliaceum]|uniref:PHD finger protein ING n=1 Tax=Panicum miliaceum TaxID=4540 RepID=A0A3L6TNW6_PANMI|nr:PHD finger protein ING1-like isoform X3 [Panicum miliaceum]